MHDTRPLTLLRLLLLRGAMVAMRRQGHEAEINRFTSVSLVTPGKRRNILFSGLLAGLRHS